MIYICDHCSEEKDSGIDGYYEYETYYSFEPPWCVCEKCLDKNRYSQEFLAEMGD